MNDLEGLQNESTAKGRRWLRDIFLLLNIAEERREN
jgi:hypothetical protein